VHRGSRASWNFYLCRDRYAHLKRTTIHTACGISFYEISIYKLPITKTRSFYY